MDNENKKESHLVLEDFLKHSTKTKLNHDVPKHRLACYSLFLNRDPGDTPGKKKESFPVIPVID